ncbi:MAG: DNA repair protein RecN [Fimbriimonadaceae bacterium]|nr:DNA repair protein RecN [Fimbriimonadaceae bacterium]
MLLELELRDFAIVRQARVEFGPGLGVLTGETGAGKSLIVDALTALLGGRAAPELVRHGAELARLRGVFDISAEPTIAPLLAEWDLTDDDGLLVITRELPRTGRGRCAVNGSTVALAALRQLGEELVDLHGQHEHQSLLRVSRHLALLDQQAGPPVAAALAAWRANWERWRTVLTALESAGRDTGERERRADLLRFQVAEITAAAVRADELSELHAERHRLAHAERLLELAARAAAALQGDEAGGALDALATAAAAVQDMTHFDPALSGPAAELEAALATVGEVARELRHYADSTDADPGRLDAVEQRLDELDRLRRKYGDSLTAVLEFAAAAQAELDSLESADERLAALQAEQAVLRQQAGKLGATLSAARAAAAAELAAAVSGHLAGLGMPQAQFAVQQQPRPAEGLTVDAAQQQVGAAADGCDAVELLFSANPGEPLRPLARIASGGELSRVMLALKSQLAATAAPPTMVFDEIDVGIGGVTIHAVARQLAALAQRRQVLCITHHAPIAARAATHLAVSKAPEVDSTAVTVAALDDAARIAELARMLGRMPPTAATLAMARELLAEVAAEQEIA